jgi:hypothetical protein
MSTVENIATAVTIRPKCWTEGCEEQQAHFSYRVTYWCERHDAERRERITKMMSEITNDSYGIPRILPGTHEITIHAGHNMIRNRDFWWWKCTCGQESQAESRNEGIAKSAGKRHVTGAMRRAA